MSQMSDDRSKKAEETTYLGKYQTREDAEKGFRNLVGAADQYKTENAALRQQLASLQATTVALQAAVTSREAPQPQTPPNLTDEEGRLDSAALLAAINAQVAPLRQALEKVPDLVNESVAQVLRPLSQAADARTKFFAREDVEGGFTQAELDRMLRENPSIRKAHERMLATPDSQGDAYEVVYDLWKSSRTRTAIQPKEKREATEPVPTGGPSLPTTPEQASAVQTMRTLADTAQDLLAPEAQIAFAREWIKGSKIEGKLVQPEEWDEKTPDSEALV